MSPPTTPPPRDLRSFPEILSRILAEVERAGVRIPSRLTDIGARLETCRSGAGPPGPLSTRQNSPTVTTSAQTPQPSAWRQRASDPGPIVRSIPQARLDPRPRAVFQTEPTRRDFAFLRSPYGSLPYLWDPPSRIRMIGPVTEDYSTREQEGPSAVQELRHAVHELSHAVSEQRHAASELRRDTEYVAAARTALSTTTLDVLPSNLPANQRSRQHGPSTDGEESVSPTSGTALVASNISRNTRSTPSRWDILPGLDSPSSLRRRRYTHSETMALRPRGLPVFSPATGTPVQSSRQVDEDVAELGVVRLTELDQMQGLSPGSAEENWSAQDGNSPGIINPVTWELATAITPFAPPVPQNTAPSTPPQPQLPSQSQIHCRLSTNGLEINYTLETINNNLPLAVFDWSCVQHCGRLESLEDQGQAIAGIIRVYVDHCTWIGMRVIDEIMTVEIARAVECGWASRDVAEGLLSAWYGDGTGEERMSYELEASPV